jgi:MoaA/NifB/PqqE/SkfB family radical SAM enzyme
MLKENISEVPFVPIFAKEMGIEEVVFTNICHCTTFWQEEQRVFLWEGGANQYEGFMKQAEAKGRELKIRVKRPSLTAFDAPLCSENPLINLYISVDGTVSPCVYLSPPLEPPFKRIFRTKEYWVEKVNFGNIFDEPFPEIWKRRPYVQFRNCFIQRKEGFNELYLSLLDNPKSRNLKKIRLPDPPESCKTCHKILGV